VAEKAAQAVVKRVSRRREEEWHSGAWKVAFADFCLALLCLFLVLWLLAARQQEAMQDLLKAAGGNLIDDGRGRLSESLGGPRGSLISREPLPSDGNTLAPRRLNPGEHQTEPRPQDVRLSKTVYESRADMAELMQVLDKLGIEAGLAGNVQSVITPYGLRVMLHDTEKQGMFERGRSVPSERFAELLRKLGPLFGQIENQMLVVGHTDSLQYRDRGPTGQSNWTLSSERAMAARSYLMMGGMPAESVLQVVGLADRAPLNAKNTAAHENRRIELLILTKGQASGISAMFGAPGETQPLIDGAETSLPDRDAIVALRGQLGTPKSAP